MAGTFAFLFLLILISPLLGGQDHLEIVSRFNLVFCFCFYSFSFVFFYFVHHHHQTGIYPPSHREREMRQSMRTCCEKKVPDFRAFAFFFFVFCLLCLLCLVFACGKRSANVCMSERASEHRQGWSRHVFFLTYDYLLLTDSQNESTAYLLVLLVETFMLSRLTICYS